MQESKSKVTALPSEKNICFSLTAVCPTYVSHLVKPYETFLALIFNTYDITEYHSTVRKINKISFLDFLTPLPAFSPPLS